MIWMHHFHMQINWMFRKESLVTFSTSELEGRMSNILMIFLVRFTCEFLVSVLTIKSHVSGYIFWVIWYICRRLKCSSFQTQMFNSDVIFDQLLVKDFFTEGTDFFPCLLLMVGCRKQTDPNALGCNVRNGLMKYVLPNDAFSWNVLSIENNWIFFHHWFHLHK